MWTVEHTTPFMDQWNHIKAGTAPAFQENEVKLKWLLQKPRANKLIYHIYRKWYKLFGLQLACIATPGLEGALLCEYSYKYLATRNKPRLAQGSKSQVSSLSIQMLN